ncbi:type I-B CRISPR-associated protein Cas7/Cst2/DevR [Methanocaldococcus fervens]|uniref:CRISPR-associated autoregulator, DevR family n=1 Tax=Methanocaldococcus fervens (strain DSM 4213 / JCM 15782 / AG86) TaxID=573064 RepID=C7P9L4_METFA|nr:type I-B CRISPR-associated protein Cas7/Cst2/DevR [Methanocaldococcus fervens]ACV25246.1 CRISPR-associated autoregulator, DevR family [Methanocaldococcus fervens AG86]
MKGIEIVWLSKTDLTNLNSGEGESNFIDVKKFKKNGIEYPYVSGQAMRYYIKEAIRRNLNENEFMCVPDDKGETCGDIKNCIGCDLFGFMKPEKDVGARTRVSPVKVSPAIGLLPFDENSAVDFLTRRYRGGEKSEGDIVNVEIGVNIYKVGIAIDVKRVGGEEKIENGTVKIDYCVNDEERKNRISKVIESLRYLSDYSKQARLLTDFTPDFIIIAFQDKYSHRLQKAIDLKANTINVELLKAILNDVSEYSPKIFAGLIPCLFENEEEVKNIFEDLNIKVKAPHEAIKDALSYLEEINL